MRRQARRPSFHAWILPSSDHERVHVASARTQILVCVCGRVRERDRKSRNELVILRYIIVCIGPNSHCFSTIAIIKPRLIINNNLLPLCELCLCDNIHLEKKVLSKDDHDLNMAFRHFTTLKIYFLHLP